MSSEQGSGGPPERKPEPTPAAVSDERRRIARDLHDGTSQLLTVMQLTLGRLKRSTGDEAAALIEEFERAVREIRDQIRGFYRDL